MAGMKPAVAESLPELAAAVAAAVRVDPAGRLTLSADPAVVAAAARDLAWSSAFAADPAVAAAARALLHAAATASGVWIAPAPAAAALPAVALRTQTAETAAALLAIAAGRPFAFLHHPDEQVATAQRAEEHAASLLAGALIAGVRGPLLVAPAPAEQLREIGVAPLGLLAHPELPPGLAEEIAGDEEATEEGDEDEEDPAAARARALRAMGAFKRRLWECRGREALIAAVAAELDAALGAASATEAPDHPPAPDPGPLPAAVAAALSAA